MADPLLTETERARLRHFGGEAWVRSRSPGRVRKRRRLYDTVDRLVEFQRQNHAPNPTEPRLLAALLAVTLRHTGTIVRDFERRHASDLQTEEDWQEFLRLFASALMERWFKDRDGAAAVPDTERLLYTPEEYMESLGDLLRLAQEDGRRAQDEDTSAGDESTNLPQLGDLLEGTRQRIFDLLAESDDLSHEATNGEIPLSEQELEIEKAVLVKLRVRDLQELAAERGVPLISNAERLAELVARQGNIAREDIAEFTIRHQAASVEQGLVTRLIPLEHPPDLNRAESQLGPLAGNYAKLRTARWFVFDQVDRQGQLLRLRGRLRSYATKPVLETDSYKINATPHAADIRVRLRDNQTWAEVDARAVADARDMRMVLSRGAGVPPSSAVSAALPALTGTLATWDRLTVWMLAFLELEFEDTNTHFHNFAMAHFEEPETAAPAAPDQPRLREVQLRGQHVGSHRDACQRIVDGQRLSNIEVAVRYSTGTDDSCIITIRIGIATDHATVMTAPSRDVPTTVVADLHRGLIEKVRGALDVQLDVASIGGRVHQIIDRARQAEPAQTADWFAPEPEIEPADGADVDEPLPHAPR